MATKKTTKQSTAKKESSSKKASSSKKTSKKQSKIVIICLCVVVLVAAALYLWGPREQVITVVYDVTGITLPEALPWEYNDGSGEFDISTIVTSVLGEDSSNASSSQQETTIATGEIASGMEIPVCAHTSDSHEVHTYTGFTLCYREKYEQAEWVAYEINKSELVKAASRTDNFRSDPAISTGSATPADYKSTGYDRGHLAPAADMSFSAEAMSESFYMSNMSPQVPGLNRGAWKDLEAAVRDWAEIHDSIYIVTGPILEKDSYPTIGNNVAVPEYYYKVLFAPNNINGSAQMIGFLFPNEKTSEDHFAYAVSVDEIEKRTDLDFFSQLDDAVENQLESTFSTTVWDVAN